MIKQKKLWDNILTVIMALLCLLWIYPIVLILLNSLKKEGTFTTSTVFQLPTSETFAGLRRFILGKAAEAPPQYGAIRSIPWLLSRSWDISVIRLLTLPAAG